MGLPEPVKRDFQQKLMFLTGGFQAAAVLLLSRQLTMSGDIFARRSWGERCYLRPVGEG